MGKSKKRPRSTSPTTNDSRAKTTKPALDPSECATAEDEQSSQVTKGEQPEKVLNTRVLEWIELINSEATLLPLDNLDVAEGQDGREDDEERLNQLWEDSLLFQGSLRSQLSHVSNEQKRKCFKYECEWKKCDFMTGRDQKYFRHVEMHAEQAQEDSEGTFTCLWDLCCFSTSQQSELMAHVHVHGYHTKLKVHGASLTKAASFPKCGYDSRFRNDISKIPLSYTCEWKDCGEKFDKIMQFIHHTVYHVYDNMPPGKKSVRDPVKCMWARCNFTHCKMYKFMVHLQAHTKHRDVACFNCGAMFFERSMFKSHCLRQVDLRYRKFKCDECDKYFATDRLLKNHIDGHMLHVACPKCPRRFPTPSIMTAHLRRIHLKLRPMACTQCEYKAYTPAELKKHMNRHSTRRLYRCDEFGCNATFRCETSLKIHIIKHYNLPPPHYACHLCDAGYGSGWLLSKHLNFAHELKPKPGSYRYRYKVDPEDGFFKVDVYFHSKEQEQQKDGPEEAPKEGAERSKDHDDTVEHERPAEAQTTINDIQMIGEHELAIVLGMELKEGDTNQSDEQTTATKRGNIVKENISPLKNKEKSGSAELKEDKKANKLKKVQEFTVMKRYLKSD